MFEKSGQTIFVYAKLSYLHKVFYDLKLNKQKYLQD